MVGGGIKNPQDALTIGRRAIQLGFTSTIGIIHDGDGQLKPLGAEERSVWEEMRSWKKKNYSRFNQFQEAIANGETNDWRCRAGSRYLYICENGLVHYCSQQRGFPGSSARRIHTSRPQPRISYRENLRAPLHHQLRASDVSYIDHWRAPQTSRISPGIADGLVKISS